MKGKHAKIDNAQNYEDESHDAQEFNDSSVESDGAFRGRHVRPMSEDVRETSAVDTLTVRVSSLSRGLEEFKFVKMVGVKSVDHDILIMDDHFPVMGEVVGSVVVYCGDREFSYDGIRGFYISSHNQFDLVITGKSA